MPTSIDLLTEQTLQAPSAMQGSPVQIALFLGALSLLSSALVMMTAFTRIVIVLSFVRRALSTQEIPPTPVIIGLSLFLTAFVMGPTMDAIERDAVRPYLAGDLLAMEAWHQGEQHLRTFMLNQVRQADLALFCELAHLPAETSLSDIPTRVLVPAFVTSELKTAFIMGFCLYLPFLMIDLVVSVVLTALGMIMMPPVVISTPCKLLLFVLLDGWVVLLKALSLSFMSK